VASNNYALLLEELGNIIGSDEAQNVNAMVTVLPVHSHFVVSDTLVAHECYLLSSFITRSL